MPFFLIVQARQYHPPKKEWMFSWNLNLKIILPGTQCPEALPYCCFSICLPRALDELYCLFRRRSEDSFFSTYTAKIQIDFNPLNILTYHVFSHLETKKPLKVFFTNYLYFRWGCELIAKLPSCSRLFGFSYSKMTKRWRILEGVSLWLSAEPCLRALTLMEESWGLCVEGGNISPSCCLWYCICLPRLTFWSVTGLRNSRGLQSWSKSKWNDTERHNFWTAAVSLSLVGA